MRISPSTRAALLAALLALVLGPSAGCPDNTTAAPDAAADQTIITPPDAAADRPLTDAPTLTDAPIATADLAPGTWWSPAPGQTWQWQLGGLPLDTTVNAAIYDVDVDSTAAATVAALHAAGRKVVCYVDVGTYESYRADAADFPPAILGKVVDGWPEEKWLDIRALDKPAGPTGKTLRQILLARLDTCRQKGFDAIEPDWLDGYANDTGFPLTSADQLVFNRFIAQAAHARGLGVALKNDKEQAQALVSDFDFGVDEECQHWSECGGTGTTGDPGWRPFVAAKKAVLNAEYTDQTSSCAQPAGLSSILKHRNLDAWLKVCPYP